jgi:hypothetical protein
MKRHQQQLPPRLEASHEIHLPWIHGKEKVGPNVQSEQAAIMEECDDVRGKTATKPEVVAANPMLGERVAATPAISDDTLFVRIAGHLYAFAEKNRAGGRAVTDGRCCSNESDFLCKEKR